MKCLLFAAALAAAITGLPSTGAEARPCWWDGWAWHCPRVYYAPWHYYGPPPVYYYVGPRYYYYQPPRRVYRPRGHWHGW